MVQLADHRAGPRIIVVDPARMMEIFQLNVVCHSALRFVDLSIQRPRMHDTENDRNTEGNQESVSQELC